MLKKSIMIQGTTSDAGKSVLCTALCRIFTQDGYHVNPFKAQNMALNSYTTYDGHEIGRAQAVQAEACNQPASAEMNPLLLKPTSDRRSQIILNGQIYDTLNASDFYKQKESFRSHILDAFHALQDKSDIVVLEGAGSPAEINLKQHDLVNMSMAQSSDSPVLLVADIDRGGVFASLYGTVSLLTPEERARVKGFIINKFRGDPSLLQDGLRQIEALTGIPVLGVIPHMELHLDDEDSVVDFAKFTRNPPDADLDIVSIRLPYMANFNDINPLLLEPKIRFRFIEPIDTLGTPQLIVLLGTKNSMEAARVLHETGMVHQIRTAYQNGSCIFGICGGFQLLGRALFDPHHHEGDTDFQPGIGLFDLSTQFGSKKYTGMVHSVDQMFGLPIKGYELHQGCSIDYQEETPFAFLGERKDGAIHHDRRVAATYLHGIFDNGGFTRSYLNMVRNHHHIPAHDGPLVDYVAFKHDEYDRLARVVRQHIDLPAIYRLMSLSKHTTKKR